MTQYYAAIVHSVLQTSDHTESFNQFCGHLALTFGSCSKLGRTSSWAAAVETASSMVSEELQEPHLSKNSWQCQNKIDQQASRISNLEAQNQKKTSSASRAQIPGQYYHPGCGQ